MEESPAQRWSLRFVDREIEQGYRDERAAGARRRIRVLFPASLLLWCSAVWFDLTAPAEMGARNAVIRFGLGAPAFLSMALFAWMAGPERFSRWWQRGLVAAYAVVLGATVALSAVAVPPFVPHGIIGFLIVLVIGGSLALLSLPQLVAVSAAGCVAELIVLAGHPDVTAFDVSAFATWIVFAEILVLVIGYQLEAFGRRLYVQQLLLERERGRAEGLLLNVMPRTIADRLKRHADAIADHFDGVTVVFADIAGFTGLASRMTPAELVARLDDVFSRLDDIVHRHGLEKIKTIGDQYMAVAGAPAPRADHAEAAARVALEICQMVHAGGDVQFRVGVASGPAVAGVIGKSRFSYDLWGDTVNLASRMESHGVPGRVQVDGHTRDLLCGHFTFEDRGEIDIKGKGRIQTYFLLSEARIPEA